MQNILRITPYFSDLDLMKTSIFTFSLKINAHINETTIYTLLLLKIKLQFLQEVLVLEYELSTLRQTKIAIL